LRSVRRYLKRSAAGLLGRTCKWPALLIALDLGPGQAREELEFFSHQGRAFPFALPQGVPSKSHPPRLVCIRRTDRLFRRSWSDGSESSEKLCSYAPRVGAGEPGAAAATRRVEGAPRPRLTEMDRIFWVDAQPTQAGALQCHGASDCGMDGAPTARGVRAGGGAPVPDFGIETEFMENDFRVRPRHWASEKR